VLINHICGAIQVCVQNSCLFQIFGVVRVQAQIFSGGNRRRGLVFSPFTKRLLDLFVQLIFQAQGSSPRVLIVGAKTVDVIAQEVAGWRYQGRRILTFDVAVRDRRDASEIARQFHAGVPRLHENCTLFAQAAHK
jgi:hypothetical protein